MNVIKKSRVRNIDQNFADVISKSPKDGVKSYLAGTEWFGINGYVWCHERQIGAGLTPGL